MKSEKGQSLVEFALIIPILVLLLLGIADFGRAFHVYLTIDHAGREAARAASIGKENDRVIEIAKEKAAGIDTTETIVTVTPNPLTSGVDATITITQPFTFITPLLGDIAKKLGLDKLEDTTVMRVE